MDINTMGIDMDTRIRWETRMPWWFHYRRIHWRRHCHCRLCKDHKAVKKGLAMFKSQTRRTHWWGPKKDGLAKADVAPWLDTIEIQTGEARNKNKKVPSCGKNNERDGSDPFCLVETDHSIDSREASHDGVSQDTSVPDGEEPSMSSEKVSGIRDQEREALQEQDDEQGDELEDGLEQETIEQRVITKAEDRVKKVEKVLKKTIKKLEEELVAYGERIEAEQLLDEDQEYMDDKDLHRFVQGLFHDGVDTEDDGLAREDRLGRAGPLETMDEDELD
ncbi:MAG: hypothetical protein J3Q66DRAFT_111590 [Benniella sp.]|nr:MAG: hypothetical protein J3Q66DRAFT_111590 [Benniella sp.]